MMYIVQLRNQIILFLAILSLFLITCEKTVPQYAVVVANYMTHPSLSEKVFITKSQSKSKELKVTTDDTENTNTKSYTLPRKMLLLFDSKKQAQNFSLAFQPYVSTSTKSSEVSIIRETPNISSPKIVEIQANKELHIISPLLTPNDVYSEKVTNNSVNQDNLVDHISKGYWIRVQHNVDGDEEYMRGWILLSHNNTILFNSKNMFNAGTLINNFTSDNYWRTAQAIEYISKFLNIPKEHSTELFLDEYNKKEQSPTIVLTQDTNVTNLPISRLWPLSHYSAIIPSNNIQISWSIENKEIILIYPSGKSELYLPTVKTVQKKPKPNTRTIQPFRFLIQEASSSSNSFVTWKSSLYGTMYLSAVEGSFTINIDWNIPTEISELYYPPNTTNIRGTITFTHSLADSVESDTDAVLTLYDNYSQSTVFLAIKFINNSKISLQFIPEANVLTDTKTDLIITATPALPKMVFESKSIPSTE